MHGQQLGAGRLGTSRPVGTVFLYRLGMSAQATIETSDDGLKWTVRGKQKAAEFLAIALPAGSAGRYVRLRSADDTETIFALTELAIY